MCMNIGLGDIHFILKYQSASPKYYYIGARKLNQTRAARRRLSLLHEGAFPASRIILT